MLVRGEVPLEEVEEIGLVLFETSLLRLENLNLPIALLIQTIINRLFQRDALIDIPDPLLVFPVFLELSRKIIAPDVFWVLKLWRGNTEILDVHNRVSFLLRFSEAVEELDFRDGAGFGRVEKIDDL
jgi:hypothetical protein